MQRRILTALASREVQELYVPQLREKPGPISGATHWPAQTWKIMRRLVAAATGIDMDALQAARHEACLGIRHILLWNRPRKGDSDSMRQIRAEQRKEITTRYFAIEEYAKIKEDHSALRKQIVKAYAATSRALRRLVQRGLVEWRQKAHSGRYPVLTELGRANT
jgi:hypothetical protein